MITAEFALGTPLAAMRKVNVVPWGTAAGIVNCTEPVCPGTIDSVLTLLTGQ